MFILGGVWGGWGEGGMFDDEFVCINIMRFDDVVFEY